MSLKNRSFLKLLDYTPAEIEQLLDLAADLKAKKKAGIAHDRLHGKNIALIFEKTSTRTRCSLASVWVTFSIYISAVSASLVYTTLMPWCRSMLPGLPFTL